MAAILNLPKFPTSKLIEVCLSYTITISYISVYQYTELVNEKVSLIFRLNVGKALNLESFFKHI